MKLKSKNNDGDLTIYFEGHVDSKNANELESEVNKILNSNKFENLIIDANDLEYISSAGLRLILKLMKDRNLSKIINVSPEVFDIFEMTGFTEMLEVEKKFREVSVEGCEIIGTGANGNVYKIDDETIVKIYKNHDAMGEIKREREFAKKAFILGIPTAISYDVVKCGDYYGTCFELLNATSYAKLIANNPDKIDSYVDDMVDVLKKIHSVVDTEKQYPDIKNFYFEWLKMIEPFMSKEENDKLVSLVKGVENKQTLIHGDFHAKNLMMQNNEPLLIDMDTLSRGHPIFEFASIYMGYVGFSIFDHDTVKNFLGIDFDTASYVYDQILKKYFVQKTSDEIEEIKKKIKLVAFIRFDRKLHYDERRNHEKDRPLLAFVEQELKELSENIDDLNF